MNTTRIGAAALAGVLLTFVASRAPAQSIAQQVRSAPDGEVRISYASRPGVCGNGETLIGIRRPGEKGTSTWMQSNNVTVSGAWDHDRWEDECEPGPVRLALVVERGQVTGLRPYVGGAWRPADRRVTNLGTVPASAAASYLLSLAESAEPSVAEKAIFPATLADETTIWPGLLRIARNAGAPQKSRTQAVFWLGQAAGEVVTRELGSLVEDASTDRKVREQAVFALSQRPPDEGVPALIGIARTHPDPAIRKKALFWLGQSGDPRAVALFEEILTEPYDGEPKGDRS